MNLDNTNAKSQYSAVIIGAGPAGLTVAYSLLKNSDIKPIIIEASPYVGGISRTHNHNGNRMDLGGHRFFTKSEKVMKLWLSLMPLQGTPACDDILSEREVELAPGGPDPENDEYVMLKRKRVSRIYFLKKFFDYPISIKPQTFINLGLFRTIWAGVGYLSACIFKRKENSLEDFYINRFGKPLYSMFFENYTEKVWGRHPSQISPDWGAQRVKGLSILKILSSILLKPFINSKNIETSLIEEFYYPKRGPGQLYEKMAEDIIKMGGKIIFESTVIGITLDDNGNIWAVSASNGATVVKYPTGILFSSMPIKDLINAIENAPHNVRNIANDLPYRDYIAVGISVKKLVIDKLKDCWIYIQDSDVKLGRLQIYNNWSPYMVADSETIWLGLEYFCNEGDELWSMSQEVFISFATVELVKIGIIKAEDVIDSVHVKVKKAYPAYFNAYKDFDVVRNYLDGVNNLYCIGRNGQHRYNNMDHSIETALSAVELFLSGCRDKTSIWNVNTEKRYHEGIKP